MTEPSVLKHLIEIGISLSVERDTTRLLERILTSAQTLTQADGGTIYSITADKSLKFETLINNSLNMYMGGSSGQPIPFPSIPIYKDGEVNQHAIVAIAAAEGDVAVQPASERCHLQRRQIGARVAVVVEVALDHHALEQVRRARLRISKRRINLVEPQRLAAVAEQFEHFKGARRRFDGFSLHLSTPTTTALAPSAAGQSAALRAVSARRTIAARPGRTATASHPSHSTENVSPPRRRRWVWRSCCRSIATARRWTWSASTCSAGDPAPTGLGRWQPGLDPGRLGA